MISHAYYSSPGSLGKTILKKIRKKSFIRLIPSPMAVINVQFAANNCNPFGDE